MDIIYSIDFSILDALQSIRCVFLNYFFGFFTTIGNGGALWIAAAVILLIIAKTRKMGLAAALSLILELVVNEWVIKNLVQRPRPFTLRPELVTIIEQPQSYSFPSGHTCTAFAAAAAIFCHDKRLGTAAFATAAVIGFSRCYFCVHYPSDVLCGALIGTLLGVLASAVISAVSRRRAEKS